MNIVVVGSKLVQFETQRLALCLGAAPVNVLYSPCGPASIQATAHKLNTKLVVLRRGFGHRLLTLVDRGFNVIVENGEGNFTRYIDD